MLHNIHHKLQKSHSCFSLWVQPFFPQEFKVLKITSVIRKLACFIHCISHICHFCVALCCIVLCACCHQLYSLSTPTSESCLQSLSAAHYHRTLFIPAQPHLDGARLSVWAAASNEDPMVIQARQHTSDSSLVANAQSAHCFHSAHETQHSHKYSFKLSYLFFVSCQS